MSSPFVVHVGRIRKAIGTRCTEHRRGRIENLAVGGSTVPPAAECRAEVVLEAVLGGVSVSGTVSAPWQGVCRRCLAPASGEVQVDVRELYTAGGDGDETYPLVDDAVDLEPLVHDAVLLELPQAPLCRPDCRGLCPVCGVDRNTASCACTPPPDPRWAALDALRPGGEGPPPG